MASKYKKCNSFCFKPPKIKGSPEKSWPLINTLVTFDDLQMLPILSIVERRSKGRFLSSRLFFLTSYLHFFLLVCVAFPSQRKNLQKDRPINLKVETIEHLTTLINTEVWWMHQIKLKYIVPWMHIAELREPVAGVCGLQNLGNTCFVNAGLQCLFSVTPFCRFFLGRILKFLTMGKKEMHKLSRSCIASHVMATEFLQV